MIDPCFLITSLSYEVRLLICLNSSVEKIRHPVVSSASHPCFHISMEWQLGAPIVWGNVTVKFSDNIAMRNLGLHYVTLWTDAQRVRRKRATSPGGSWTVYWSRSDVEFQRSCLILILLLFNPRFLASFLSSFFWELLSVTWLNGAPRRCWNVWTISG